MTPTARDIVTTVLACGTALAIANAQSTPAPEPAGTDDQPTAIDGENAQQDPPAADPDPAPEPELPGLDDLLGIEGASDEPTDDPNRDDLERVLTGAEVGDAFQQAVSMMGDVAGRLETRSDTSLTTQRLQEDIVRRLDQLIESIKQNQSESSSSSSSSSSSQQQQQGQQPNQPQQQQQSGQSGEGEGGESTDAPAMQEGALRPGLDPATAGWGALPPRVRDMLSQGRADPFSRVYQRLTEEYYRRLAEESSGGDR